MPRHLPRIPMSKNERDSRHAKTESPAQWIGQAIFVCPLKPGWIIGPVLFVSLGVA